MRLLCADDDPDIRTILRLALTLDHAFEVEIVESGERALAQAFADRPDAILLDAMMPGVDGYETCRRLKANPDTAAVPVVFLTAKAGTAERERARAIGAAGCLVKPFDPLTLAGQLRDLLTANS